MLFKSINNGPRTPFMSAPFCADPFTTATAELPPRFASDFARLTSCVEPNESWAGRFSRDMVRMNARGYNASGATISRGSRVWVEAAGTAMGNFRGDGGLGIIIS